MSNIECCIDLVLIILKTDRAWVIVKSIQDDAIQFKSLYVGIWTWKKLRNSQEIVASTPVRVKEIVYEGRTC